MKNKTIFSKLFLLTLFLGNILVTTNLSKKFVDIVDGSQALVLMSGTLHLESVLRNIFGIEDFVSVDAEKYNQGTIEILKSGKEFDCKYANFQSNKIFDGSEEYPKIFKIDKSKTLRYYQSNGLEIMKNNVIGKLILPTGSGKTVIFLEYLFCKTGLLLIIVPTIIFSR